MAWAQAINQNLFKVVEKLRSKKIPSTAVLKESAASISLYLDVLYEGIVKGLPKTILNAPEIPKTVIEEKLKFLLEQMQNYRTLLLLI